MSTDEPRDDLAANLLTMRIITGALIAGVVVFLAITFVVRSDQQGPIFVTAPDLGLSSIFVLLGLVGALLCVLAAYFVPPLLVANQRRQLAEGRFVMGPNKEVPKNETLGLVMIYQSQMIVSLALLEGAAFFNAIAFMLEGSPLSLGLALLLLGVMALWFPTRSGLESWLAEQSILLRDDTSQVR